MPIHDWSRIDPGIFHHFHQTWTIEICNTLNAGGLPPGFFAMAQRIVSGPIPDVVTLQRLPTASESPSVGGGIAAAESPPKARLVMSAGIERYAGKANRILIKHRVGHVVTLLEVVSPGDKNSQHALRALVQKAGELLRLGINLLIMDLFPPSPRDPQGIQKAIWDEIQDEPFELPPDKPLTVAAYSADESPTAYIEPVAVGDVLPEMPIFLEPGIYVPAPLETTYEAAWAKCPDAIREIVEHR